MKIKRVILTNFRAFKNVQTIEFDDFNCIIGKNDVGKSSILVALDWFFGNRELSDIDINNDNIVNDSSGFVIGGDELSVEIDFEVQFDTDVPNFFSDENRHLYRKDFLDGNNLRIKKYYLHSSSHQLDNDYYVKKTGYYVFTKHYNSFGNRPLSFLAIEELKAEGSKIGQFFDTIKANIQKDIELQKQNSPNDVALQTVLRLEELNIDSKTFEQICDDLSAHSNVNYQWDYEPIEDNSMDFILKSNGEFPKFRFFNAETPLNEYIKLLFSGTSTQNAQKEIDALKNNVAQQISSQVFPNGQSETFSFSSDYEYLANSLLLSDKGIPLSNRGDGFQLRIKNAVFRLLSAQNAVSTQPMVFVFEEPETHLHPSAQREMYETIQKLSVQKFYQIVITSHSPYIVNALSENKTEIIVVKRENDNTTAKNVKLSSERLIKNYVSMSELNYIAFNEPSIGYHIELFAYMQNKLNQSNVADLDQWLRTNISNIKLYNWYNTKTFNKEQRSLPHCVRNNIDHPIKVDDTTNRNKHKAYLNNKKYNELWVIKMSINVMYNAIQSNIGQFT